MTWLILIIVHFCIKMKNFVVLTVICKYNSDGLLLFHLVTVMGFTQFC